MYSIELLLKYWITIEVGIVIPEGQEIELSQPLQHNSFLLCSRCFYDNHFLALYNFYAKLYILKHTCFSFAYFFPTDFPCHLFVEETGIDYTVSYRFDQIQIWCFCQNFVGDGCSFIRGSIMSAGGFCDTRNSWYSVNSINS